jgi:hypothetical protein
VVSDLLNSPLLRIGFYLVDVFFMVLWLSVVYWTFIDADRRGTPRFFWASVALIFPFIGTLIYVIVHPPEYLLDSRERELDLAVLEREFRRRAGLCPNCRSPWRRSASSCARSAVGTSKSPARTAGGSCAWTGYLPVLRDGAEQKVHQLVGG